MKILSVDDNAANLYLIETIVRAHGHEVVSAHNGLEALDRLEEAAFDLIISDILMPEMDGFNLCHEVKSRERMRHIPFVFYTATYTTKQDEELGLALGASRFILKPLEPERFMAVIDDVIRESHQGTTADRQSALNRAYDYLSAYNARLIRKLDHKVEQLEAAKRQLELLLGARDSEIAERKRVEQERSRLEAQFLQAQKLESIGRLAGGIAHDFNNLLMVINGNSELALKQVAESDPVRVRLEEILGAGQRAATLTRQLLAFSRRQESAPSPLNLSRIVANVRDMIQRLVGDDVEIVTKLSPLAGTVMADDGQLHQVLLNLVVNARDAMPTGGRLIIETARIDLDQSPAAAWTEFRCGCYVMLAVTDTGTGMDETTLHRIFEPFFTTKPVGKGTGLGLSTVYGIVRQSGGWVVVESQPEVGSTFRVYLPQIEISAADSARLIDPTPKGTETVLVAEDDAAVRSLIVGILRECGYGVLQATNGENALHVAEHHNGSIALLVSDIQMPGMKGQELAIRLKQQWPSIRVLLISGGPEGVSDGSIVPDSELAVMRKPFGPGTLASKVRELLDARRVSTSLRSASNA